MSADPVTLAVISFGIQAAGTYSDLQAKKAQNKAIIREYETEKKYNQLKGLQDSNDVLEEARRKRKQNLAIVAGSGYSDTSRHFLSTQTEIDRIAAKDVSNIKINTLRGESKIETQIYTTKVMGKAQEFGAYANIAASAFKPGAYAKSSETNPQGGQYDLSNTNKMDDN